MGESKDVTSEGGVGCPKAELSGESKDVTSEGDGTTKSKGEFIVYLYSINLDVC